MTAYEQVAKDHSDQETHRRGATAPSGSRRSSAGAQGPRFYSVAEVAEMLGMAPVTLYRAIREGQFPAVRIRGRLIVPGKAVDAIIDAAVADSARTDASWSEDGSPR